MEVYRHTEETNKRNYCVVVYIRRKTGKIGLVVNIHDEAHIRDYWKNNEEPDYSILEVKPIKNVSAYLYFQYWMRLPRTEKTEEQRQKKFDFYKYVCGADLSDKYRGVEFITEIKESKVA